MPDSLTAEILLRGYTVGVFPMAESRDSQKIHWVDPTRRAVFPLDNFHISRSLRKTILAEQYQPKLNTDFAGVLDGCADRAETWINPKIRKLYLDLFAMGHAHSQEIWDDEQLVGGVYGVSLGRAFFGESMFSRRRDASKIALAWLIDRLRQTGFCLFDTQFMTPHLQSLGAVEIDREVYLAHLQSAMIGDAQITEMALPQSAQDVIQRSTQTS